MAVISYELSRLLSVALAELRRHRAAALAAGERTSEDVSDG